jgi:hypothetical protein
MIKVCCLKCGHSLMLGEAYDDYAGKIRCWGCHAILVLALEAGKLRSMHVGAPSLAPQSDVRPPAYGLTADPPAPPAFVAEPEEVNDDER